MSNQPTCGAYDHLLDLYCIRQSHTDGTRHSCPNPFDPDSSVEWKDRRSARR